MLAGTMFVEASEFLPDEHVRELAKCDDLEAIQHLAFSVDTTENSLGDLGRRLPALRELRLDGSNIKTLRDLGAGLGELRVLWIGRSALRELEGIGAFGALTEHRPVDVGMGAFAVASSLAFGLFIMIVFTAPRATRS